jgi:SulP family sulfate permease
MKNLAKLFPGLQRLKGYSRATARKDCLSGITIACMLIPQGMGYALVAGLPAELGLYACIIPPVIYALLGTSNKLSIGPVALDSILILSGLSLVADPETDNYLSLVIVLTLMVGLIQLTLGLLKFGFIANFLSNPVILGYTGAAALIIMSSQLGNVLGVEKNNVGFFVMLQGFYQQASEWHWPTLALGCFGAWFLIYPKRWLAFLPWGLLLIILGMWFAGLANFKDMGIAVIDSVPEGLPSLIMPALSLDKIADLLPTALTVALMGYVGSMAICKAQESPTDKINVDPNQELIAVGVANLVGAFFKAFPVSASFSRSAAFVSAGASTQVSAIVSAVVIAAVLVFLTPVFASYPLPKVLLAVIIIISVFGLFKYEEMAALYRQNLHEFLLMLATFLSTLVFGIQAGLLAGVLLSIMRVIYNTTVPHMVELGAMQDGKLYRNVNRFDALEIRDDVLVFRFDAPLYFANKDYFIKTLYSWIKQRREGFMEAVIFDAEAVNSVDTSAIRMLLQVVEGLKQKDISFYITNATGPVRDEFMRSPLKDYLNEETMFPSIQDAICFIDNGVCADCGISMQSSVKP